MAGILWHISLYTPVILNVKVGNEFVMSTDDDDEILWSEQSCERI